MLRPLLRRLLPILQITRVGLVYTAIADSLCGLLLHARYHPDFRGSVFDVISWPQAIALAGCSGFLYAFGMSLNDLVDRRRDLALAAHRPLPSGRLGVVAGHVVCVLMGIGALLCGAALAVQTPGQGWSILLVLTACLTLIAGYDLAGKYLVAMGLLSLGVIRSLNAALGATDLPLTWHPLLLLNHIAIVSALGYQWERKRPALTGAHAVSLAGGLLVVNALALWFAQHYFPASLPVDARLLAPLAALAAYALLALWLWRRVHPLRSAGRQLVLFGLLWLIVYDAVIAMVYVHIWAGLSVLALFPLAWASVLLLRLWGDAESPNYR